MSSPKRRQRNSYRKQPHQQHQSIFKQQTSSDDLSNNNNHNQAESFALLIERKDLYDCSLNEEQQFVEPASSTQTVADDHEHDSSASELAEQLTASLTTPYSYEPEASIVPETKFSFIKLLHTTNTTTNPHHHHDASDTTSSSATSTTLYRPSIAVDRTIPNPLPADCQKYWNQRRRLFSKFDQGIILDREGWFSVTPEQIANHVAHQIASHYCSNYEASSPFILLDAFGGCGGNAIAFAKRPEISKLICVDLDRQKLRATAHNASIYDIPKDKIIFVECNVVFLLQFCYRNGNFILDAPIENEADVMAMMAAMPPAAPMEIYEGFHIGGIDLLPREIHAVFMDPPWGGVDYNAFGRYGYSLQEHMRIPRLHSHLKEKKAADDFFDSFEPTNQQERKAAFNCALDETNGVNGAELLKLAALAACDAAVVYDIPRNTNRSSLAEAALTAGYRGNCKFDEHYLNGRLKTVTVYFGKDWRNAT